MPLPKYIVRLTDAERIHREELSRTGKRAASVILHARILLKADVGEGGPGWDDAQIAEALNCGASTVTNLKLDPGRQSQRMACMKNTSPSSATVSMMPTTMMKMPKPLPVSPIASVASAPTFP